MTAQVKLVTESEYLTLERASSTRHEFYHGRVYAMTGASEAHNLIVGNTLAALHAQLRRTPCRIYPSDMRVKVAATGLYTYPDLSIVCGPPQFTDDAQDTLLNPLVIIEVLSPSTERYDRGMKFQHYRTIEALLDYVLIAQDQQRIEHFARQTGGQWLLEEITKPDGVCTLSAVAATIILDDVYEKVVAQHDDALRDTAGE
jgi:Uma2 family endonuclease